VKKLLVCFLFLISFSIFAEQEEYSFDVDEFKKKPYEFVGKLRIQPEFMFLNTSSRLYSLLFLDKESENFMDSHGGFIQLKGSYEISRFKLYADIKNLLQYTKENEVENTFYIYESYINFDISKSFSIKAGKSSTKWGKGYVWNPVSFASRPKDITNVEEGLEGFWMLKFDYVKALSGLIKNFSISSVIIPVSSNINNDFCKEEGINFILNTYFLIGNYDLGFYIFLNNNKSYKFGVDFARNILENWEIHGEYVYEKTINPVHKFLLGTRLLLTTDTTIIFEYLHNGSGLIENQMIDFYNKIDFVISGDRSYLPEVQKFQSDYLSSQFSLKNYMYLKISQPEPFNILYLTPSIFTLYNIADQSLMIGGEFIYKRFDNLDLKLRYNFLSGGTYTEFGEKINKQKILLIIEYVF